MYVCLQEVGVRLYLFFILTCTFSHFRQATKAALVIQSNYRNYRARPGSSISRQQTVHQQAAHQAARKIQQFMRQSKVK